MADTAIQPDAGRLAGVTSISILPEADARLNAAVNLFAEEVDQFNAALSVIPSGKSIDDLVGSTLSTTVLDPIAQALTPTANPLHDYATYTYGLTLFMLHKDEYNALQKADVAGGKAWDPAFALISSAGRYNIAASNLGVDPEYFDRGRPEPFRNVDFYFDNLRMQTVIGMNSRTRGTNAIDISFTIIEPMGMTLLDRIIHTATDPAGAIQSKSYLSQPYLLELDFFGSKDLGDITSPIRNLRKRFPIKIIEMKIKATSKGSEYAIKAIPFSHQSLQETMAHTPVNFEVVASDVGNFFGSLVPNTNFTAQYEATSQSNAAGNNMDPRDRRLAPPGTSFSKVPDDTPYRVESYTDAMNAWQQRLVTKGNVDVADELGFFFHNDFRISKIVTPAESNPKSTAFIDARTAQKANASGTAAGGDRSLNVFPIAASTSIVDVINVVMRGSEFIKRQLYDPTSKSPTFKQNTVVQFYKIVPHVELKDFDVKRNRYATKTIYYVIPYDYYNTKHPNLPYATPTSASKEYDYIYTGKNVDIIDFQIDFDSAFYTAVQVDRDHASRDAPVPNGDDPNAEDITPGPRGVNPTGIQQPTVEFRTGDKGAASTDVSNASDALAANTIKSIYSSSRGDMINVKLKIVGDPDFIKQDDLYTNPGQNIEGKNKGIAADGTIMMDNSEVFVKITFKTPADFDDATGLADPHKAGKYAVSKFSGIYKVLTVDNEFSRGQFVQTLDTIKIFDESAPRKPRTTDANGRLIGSKDSRVAALQDSLQKSNVADGNQSAAEKARLDKLELGVVVPNTVTVLAQSYVTPPAETAEPSENPALDQAKAESARLNRFIRNT